MALRSLLSACILLALLAPNALAEYGDESAAVLLSSQQIDELIKKAWQEHNVRPSSKISDEVFMRRLYLDVTGTIPTGKQALNFVQSKTANRRRMLIDYLLDTEGYSSHYYNYWADVLRIKSRIGQIEFNDYIEWLKQSLRENKPYDQFVYELVAAEGRIWENGAAGYYLRDNGMPLDNTSNTVSIFLGTQIGCAQCHDHPFDHWTQKQFYEIAAFTHTVSTRGVPNGNLRQIRRQVNAEMVSRDLTPQQRQKVNRFMNFNNWMVHDVPNRKLRFPKDYQYDDVKPGSLAAPTTIFGGEASSDLQLTTRQAFAQWATSGDNPYFAKTIANRLWKKVFGVGLIEPVDDIEGQQASNPELLEFLTAEMVRMKFDLKQYLRMLYNTDLYTRRAVYKEIDETVYYFPGPTLRRMTAEQLWDSLVTLTMDDPTSSTYGDLNPKRYDSIPLESTSTDEIIRLGLTTQRPTGAMRNKARGGNKKNAGPKLYRASEMRQPAAATHFLRDFGQSDRNLIEGSNTEPTVTQILTLLNGPHHYQIVREGSELMDNLKNVEKNPSLRARVIYLSILGREPSSSERRLAIGLFKLKKQPTPGNKALVWILLNTPEFMFIQ